MKHIQEYKLFESLGYNLQDDYNMINDLMFEGKLKPVPLRWMSTKYKLGVMAYTESGSIEYVGISTFYKLTRQQYLDVLAHEMIHVYMEQNSIKERDHHGSKFMAILDDLNKRFPEFKIAKSENAIDFQVGKNSKIKTYGVVLFDTVKRDNTNDISIVAVQQNVLDDNKQLDEFIDGLIKQANIAFLHDKTVSIEVYKSAHPDIPKFKIKKSLSLRSMELFVIGDEMAEDIRNESELISKVKIK